MSLIKTKKDQFVRDSSYRRREYLNSNISDRDLDKRINKSDVKITETEIGFHYELKKPGYIKADFNFYIDKDDLIVTTEKIQNKKNYNKSEHKHTGHSYCYPSAYFKRRFQLPRNIVKDKILVDYKDQVLSFDLLKIES
ncbi:Hsp20 family protein [Yeosuana sp.]|uniref:Hsp20 family protein n=1 Tax=Yeosuana sp. TaxID=2529388 RepID=UPI0040550E03|tara:strand:- start:4369 stop:4785 length:417 start_codon:yes stop_codon:yes gene_type:complete